MQAQEFAPIVSSEDFNGIVKARASLDCTYCKDHGPTMLSCSYSFDKEQRASSPARCFDDGFRIANRMEFLGNGQIIKSCASWHMGILNQEPDKKSEFIHRLGFGFPVGSIEGSPIFGIGGICRIEEKPNASGPDTFFAIVENKWISWAPGLLFGSDVFAEVLSDRLYQTALVAKRVMDIAKASWIQP